MSFRRFWLIVALFGILLIIVVILFDNFVDLFLRFCDNVISHQDFHIFLHLRLDQCISSKEIFYEFQNYKFLFLES
jgi:hypothetical protein